MADQLLFQDFADFDGILNAIKALDTANKEYGNNAVLTNERTKQSIIELRKELVGYKKLVEGAREQSQVLNMSPGVIETTTAFKNQNTILAQNQALFDSNNKVITQMQDRLVALQKEYAGLDQFG